MNIPRNDIPAALAFYKRRKAEVGEVPDDELHVLLMLQDDFDELAAEIRKIDEAEKK